MSEKKSTTEKNKASKARIPDGVPGAEKLNELIERGK